MSRVMQPLLGGFFLCLGMFLASISLAVGGEAWRVERASGEVWVLSQGAQQVALSNDTRLDDGDTIQTGPNGRVLLSKGGESILVAPNSIIELLDRSRSTTVRQRAGSVLLKIQNRGSGEVRVVTPDLAAVVKGTEFRVTVGQAVSQVDVSQGIVEVSDFRSGQYALVYPQQRARASHEGGKGLALEGSGQLGPIRQGTASQSPVLRIEKFEREASTGPSPLGDAELRGSARVAQAPASGAQSAATPSAGGVGGSRATSGGSGGSAIAWFNGSQSGRSRFENESTSLLVVPPLIGVLVMFGVATARWNRRRADGKKKNEKAKPRLPR